MPAAPAAPLSSESAVSSAAPAVTAAETGAPVSGVAAVNAAETQPPKVPVNRETLRQASRLFAYLLPYRGKFIAAMGALFISTLLGLMFPYLIGSLIDTAWRSSAHPSAASPGALAPSLNPLSALTGGAAPITLAGLTLNQIFALLVCQLIVQSFFTYFQVTWFNEVGERALLNIRRDTYSRIIALPMSFFAQRRVGELSSRISADLTQIEETLTGATPQFLRQITLLIGSMIFICVMSGRLTLVMLACFPPIILVAIIFGKKMRGVSRQAQDRLAESNTVVDETLQGIANVKAFVNEPYEIERYTSHLHSFLTAILRGVRYRAAFVSFIIFAMFGAIVVVMWYGCLLLQRGQLSAGDLTRFTIYTSFVAGAMGSFADLYSQIQKTVGATARVRELLLEEPEAVVPRIATPLGRGCCDEVRRFAHRCDSRADGAGSAQASAGRRGVRSRKFQLPVASRHDGVARSIALRAFGRTHRAGRPQRRGQIHPGFPLAALLRTEQRLHPARRTTGSRLRPARVALSDGYRPAGGAPFRRQHRRKHRLRTPWREPRRYHRRRAAGERP